MDFLRGLFEGDELVRREKRVAEAGERGGAVDARALEIGKERARIVALASVGLARERAAEGGAHARVGVVGGARDLRGDALGGVLDEGAFMKKSACGATTVRGRQSIGALESG